MEKGLDRVVIECGGVGYEVGVPASAASALPPQGGATTLYTYLNITENDVSLFGFLTAADRQMFKLLTSVSGVGPKAGSPSCRRCPVTASLWPCRRGTQKRLPPPTAWGRSWASASCWSSRTRWARGWRTASRWPTSPGRRRRRGQRLPGHRRSLLAGLRPERGGAGDRKARPALPVEELIKQALKSMAGKVR